MFWLPMLARALSLSRITEDAELLAMALDLETAKQEKRQLFQDVRHQLPGSSVNVSTSFEFADSPSQSQQNLVTSLSSLPSPPKDFYRNLSATLKATTSRAEDAELALHNLSRAQVSRLRGL